MAEDDVFSGEYNTPITGNVLENDSDPDGNALQVVESSVMTENGFTVTLAPDGAFTYAPAVDFIGADRFDYTVSDGRGGTDTATVSLNVAAPAGAIVGTTGDDAMTGTVHPNRMFGLAGNDNQLLAQIPGLAA